MNSLKKYVSVELFFWIAALVYLAMINPAKQHLTICVFHYLGASWCPGCGIGRSISYLLHGDWQNSISTHWLGTFALLIIVYRILQLIINQKTKTELYGKCIL